MLAELKLELETDHPDFGYFQSSNLQGVLMQRIDKEYAAILHEQGLKPYSQYALGGTQKEWRIKTLTAQAYERIIHPLLDDRFQEFVIEKKQMHVRICGKTVRVTPYRQLLDEFYSDRCGRYLNLEFVTPAAFKSSGRYVILPELRYIYQSMMQKYGAATADLQLPDEDLLRQLTACSSIVQYRLRSTSFPLEGVKIPSFKGEIGIKINGTDTMAKYAGLLAGFAEFSGIGIKTAIGMGGIRLLSCLRKESQNI
ncbi:CRISPR-associated endoribonuclease Cas6 [Eubacterium plexicaudatum ASF492]|uniref:CRISPR-associated endoribonuclease cas6 n=1 Tax=Eubacterium plexicaudatum ASF492 TaxID=1235802 RepID=N2BMJ8_9FIRM|nr:CRISPR-associated endoribonuclease Cas6 [Eubacterium plexicaudatum ASF492]